ITESDTAVAANSFTEAQAKLNVAKVARNQDPQIFSPDEIGQFDARIAAEQLRIDQSKSAFDSAQQQQATANAIADAQAKEAAARAAQQQAVANLISQARRLTDDGKFEQALGVIDQILVIDAKNDYARGVRPLIEDRALFQEQRRYRETF